MVSPQDWDRLVVMFDVPWGNANPRWEEDVRTEDVKQNGNPGIVMQNHPNVLLISSRNEYHEEYERRKFFFYGNDEPYLLNAHWPFHFDEFQALVAGGNHIDPSVV